MCSICVVTTCRRLARWKRAMPLMAMLLLSVAPEVKMISRGLAPIREATCSRARSTPASASQPYVWVREWAFPYCSVRKGIMASRTRGSMGVVACMSRYDGRPSRNWPRTEKPGDSTSPAADACMLRATPSGTSPDAA